MMLLCLTCGVWGWRFGISPGWSSPGACKGVLGPPSCHRVIPHEAGKLLRARWAAPCKEARHGTAQLPRMPKMSSSTATHRGHSAVTQQHFPSVFPPVFHPPPALQGGHTQLVHQVIF